MLEKIKIDELLVDGCVGLARTRLNYPRIALYESIEKIINGRRICPPAIAESCFAIEHTFGIYEAIKRALNGRFNSEFTNIYALNAGALVGLSQIREKETIPVFLNEINFSDSDFVCEQLMKEYVSLVKRCRANELSRKTAGFLEEIEKQAIIKKDKFPDLAERVSNIHLQIKGITISGFRKVEAELESLSNITTDTTIDDVVGNSEMIQKLKNSVDALLCYDVKTKRNVFSKYGFQKFFFIYGKPGAGKTTGIKAIINYAQQTAAKNNKEIKIELISNAFKSEFYSKSSQNLRNCLNKVFSGDCIYIVVLEDIDTVFFKRDFSSYDNESRANLGELLNLIDGIKTADLGNYILIATTNSTVDDALFGRLSECLIEAKGPETKEDYERLIKIQLRQCINDRLLNLDFDDAALLCHKYNLDGRDVKNICSNIKSYLFDFGKIQNLHSMSGEEQIDYIKKNCRRITKQDVIQIINNYVMKKRQHHEFANR